MRWWLLALAGCDGVLGLNTITPGTIDARGADAANITCPTSYTAMLPAPSKYRRADSAVSSFAEAVAGCLADQPSGPTAGRTHLVVISTFEELLSLSFDDGYVGLSAQKGPGYLWVTDEQAPVDPGYWDAGEPNNTDPMKSGFEPCVQINNNGRLDTVSCTTSIKYWCECDAWSNDTTRY